MPRSEHKRLLISGKRQLRASGNEQGESHFVHGVGIVRVRREPLVEAGHRLIIVLLLQEPFTLLVKRIIGGLDHFFKKHAPCTWTRFWPASKRTSVPHSYTICSG